MKLTDLKKGDIFKFGDKHWDYEYRFHSLQENENGTYTIYLIYPNFSGDIKSAKWTSFTKRDSNVDVFLPVYYLSEQKRTKGIPCIPVSNKRHILPKNLNPINLSNTYCQHNNYWYERESIIK